MAEALASGRHAAPGVAFTSGGTSTRGGPAATAADVRVMQAVGIDISDHQSRGADEVMALQPDLVYAMTAAHRSLLAAAYPEAAERILMLSPTGADIPDPYGGDDASYAEVGDLIEKAVAARSAAWNG